MSAPTFKTFGCRLNSFETEAMQGLATNAGVSNAVVVNTCSVTAEAVRTARQNIRRIRRETPDARIVVTGCAAQTEPEKFLAMPEVDLVLGNREKMDPATWNRIGSGASVDSKVSDIMEDKTVTAPLVEGLAGRARAYIQVQNGCDHRCTFCIIPYARGNSRSVSIERVVQQARTLVDRGFNELVLTGVDITSWGADLEGSPQLGSLISDILKKVPDLQRLRLSSIDSAEIDPLLFELLASDRRIMPHLHLSLQHGDNMILKRMKRRHSREDAISFCQSIRAVRPDVIFGADIIAGFPTETDEMFENSLRLVDECGLTWLHVFPYSERAGTPAARMPKVDGTIIKRRAALLRHKGQEQVLNYLRNMNGLTVSALVEKQGLGRTEGFAQVQFEGTHPPGSIARLRISGHDEQYLFGVAA